MVYGNTCSKRVDSCDKKIRASLLAFNLSYLYLALMEKCFCTYAGAGGPRGVAGDSGFNGDTGPRGAKGSPGQRGPKGDAGEG